MGYSSTKSDVAKWDNIGIFQYCSIMGCGNISIEPRRIPTDTIHILMRNIVMENASIIHKEGLVIISRCRLKVKSKTPLHRFSIKEKHVLD